MHAEGILEHALWQTLQGVRDAGMARAKGGYDAMAKETSVDSLVALIHSCSDLTAAMGPGLCVPSWTSH